MNKTLTTLLFLIAVCTPAWAQFEEMNRMDDRGNFSDGRNNRQRTDSLGSDKEIPQGIKVWTIDGRFGDITPAEVDTLSHMFMNTIFTTGMRGEYNTTGNLGAPRINRIFIDREEGQQFIFTA
ncbi:MAG TPA: putative porin, partial [Prevotella sp.]